MLPATGYTVFIIKTNPMEPDMAKSAAKPKSNLFTKAQANPIKADNGKVEPAKIKTEGLSDYAKVDAMIKQLTALRDGVLRPNIDAQMYKQFLANRGENYKGVEGKATASLQLQKRSSAAKLSDVEVTLCEKKGISTTYIAGDFKLDVTGVSEAKLQEVSDAIEKIKGLPENFIKFDATKARTVTTAESIKECFLLNDQEDIVEMLKIVGTLNVKPTTGEDLEEIVETCSGLLTDNADEIKLAMATKSSRSRD